MNTFKKHPIPFWLFLIILTVALNNGCQKRSDESSTKKLISVDNLQTAYGVAIKRARWYEQYARQAEKEGLKNAAALYRAVVRSEEIHAATHAKLLKSQGFEAKAPEVDSITVGYTRQTLKAAVSSESVQFESMYPTLIKTAEIEKFTEAADQFKQCRDVDARHSELFKEAADRNGNIPRVTYYICSECGYILTSEKTEECPVCHTKKEKFEKF